jgi:hypothetical protein
MKHEWQMIAADCTGRAEYQCLRCRMSSVQPDDGIVITACEPTDGTQTPASHES